MNFVIADLCEHMTVTLKANTEIIVPRSIRRQAGIKAGDEVEFRVSGRVISIVPKRVGKDRGERALERGIGQSEKEYREGRSAGPFDTHDAFLEALKAKSSKPASNKSRRRR